MNARLARLTTLYGAEMADDIIAIRSQPAPQPPPVPARVPVRTDAVGRMVCPSCRATLRVILEDDKPTWPPKVSLSETAARTDGPTSGIALRRERRIAEVTTVALAREMGVSRQWLYFIERAETVPGDRVAAYRAAMRACRT
ncbi:MAG: helix-turn-helix transcriptional regulator [Chloroflexota bacterium]